MKSITRARHVQAKLVDGTGMSSMQFSHNAQCYRQMGRQTDKFHTNHTACSTTAKNKPLTSLIIFSHLSKVTFLSTHHLQHVHYLNAALKSLLAAAELYLVPCAASIPCSASPGECY